MPTTTIPHVLLGSTGSTIPVIGYGTAEVPFGKYEATRQFALQAIEIGYRHFDTASAYQSETPLGDAIAEALKLGLIKSRDDLFITSKLFGSDAYPHLVLPALRKTLENLGMDYLDLYLIHFPVSLKPDSQVPFEKEDIVEMDFESVWKAMEECKDLGLTKLIGVSNFTCKKIDKLLTTARIPPAVNQVEMNPIWQQKKLRELCNEKGIHITAFSPLGGKGTPWGSSKVMESEVIKEIANTRGKTLAQVCMRWAYEQGVSIVTKSSNKVRMQESIDIFNWNLSTDDLIKIDQIPQSRLCVAEILVSEDGPHRSLMELWDGEM
ncbi:hypothetical protein K2173_013224 [Erythroxylum novogranatense]|uniref:NADP-dependent oxidoreductase domain-containing protein n=1 Tax=Erythroxylum novogranatense TaxID=1862640 RepID=A0AAV8SCS4_9ROSI|nr:hypothetical protein K2173_013224 [Erythroxylum novogranatense]